VAAERGYAGCACGAHRPARGKGPHAHCIVLRVDVGADGDVGLDEGHAAQEGRPVKHSPPGLQMQRGWRWREGGGVRR
jgi:hypothetical protein